MAAIHLTGRAREFSRRFHYKLCSSVYETTPRDLIRTENTCNTCNPRRFVKIPPDEIKERFNLAFENKKEEYQVLNYDEIVHYDSIIKLKHVHDNCNYEFETNLFSLETGYGCSCPVCYRVKVITPELFVLKFKRTNLYKSGEYELVDYKDGIPVLKHTTCGNIFESSHNGVLYFECGCPKCNVGNRFKPYSHEKFISELEEGFLENYDVMSEYTRYDEIITIKHKKCGSIIDTTPAKIISRGNCVCSNCYNLKQISSRGEAKVKAFLVDNSISFNFQHCFKECRDKYPLPFDFYIPDKNIAIEYDGEQHFEFIEYFHENEQGFEDQIRRDNIKTQYCKKNNINLVRIPYWQYPDIDNILNKVIFEE